MLVIGIDDAGRGPLIGPMVLAGVLLDDNAEEVLKKNNVRDSKQVVHSSRIHMAKIIKETALAYKIVKTSAQDIDKALATGTNLNRLEAMKAAEIINGLNNGRDKIKVVVDCPSTNKLSWKNMMIEYVENTENLTILCEHKADVNHIIVAAASILAKVTREEEVTKLKEQYGPIGSGYPSDPNTKKFLKEKGKELQDSGIFRKSWSTWKKMFPDEGQNTLF
mgnify:CR=1 FL=1